LKITIGFLLIVVSGTVVSTLIGSRIVTDAMVGEAQKRVRNGLQTARLIYEMKLDRVRRLVEASAHPWRLLESLKPGAQAKLTEVLLSKRTVGSLDFFGFVDQTLSVVTSSGGAGKILRPGDQTPLSVLVRRAMAGETLASTEILDRQTLLREGQALADRAYLPLSEVPMAAPRAERELESGLVLLAAAPVRTDQGVIGAVYGGLLLNRDRKIVDEVRQAIFGGETYGGQEVGAASLFLGDVRVSTNVRGISGRRAIGTRVSAVVGEAVLGRGQPWLDRAFVVNEWYLTAYEPLRNSADQIVGMLYVGVQEAPYLAVRTDMMVSFLIVALLGLLIVIGLTYVITGRMIRPLEEMVVATKRGAAGDLDHPVNVPSGDEIGHLAWSFNQMLASLKAARQESEQWARTLEQRVEQRTEELGEIQSKMAQAERLASLGRMAAGVAHEINNPLGGVLTFAMVALEDCAPDHPLRRNLEIIVKQALRCRDIVKGLLEFARQSDSSIAATDLNPLVEGALSFLEGQASFHDVQVIRRLQEGLPQVLADPGAMQQVITNLVINAVDAMDERGQLTVVTETDPNTHEILLRVQDTGKGIPKEILPLIFEPFFTTKEVGRGTGLGLAIVHGIVARTGGRVEVDTSQAGSTFTVRLPLASPPRGDRSACPKTAP
jgi:two-component system NtrC family sensor kinase